jgi:hypothetical protein
LGLFDDVILDEDFDKSEFIPVEHSQEGSASPADDLAWDDQLDNGDEMSL